MQKTDSQVEDPLPADTGPDPIEQAVDSFRAGDRREENFRFLFDTYYRPVRSFFAKRAATPDACLDLTQETFLRAYRGLDDFRGEAPFGAWLFRIAWNVLRRREGAAASLRERELPWPDAGLEDGRGITLVDGGEDAAGGSALEEILRLERRSALREAIEALPPQRRKCMLLWAYQELSYEQIATVMQLSLGTIKAHLAQARQQLAEEMMRRDPESPR